MNKFYTTSAIRQAFLAYFERHRHTVVSSSSLVPIGDPTLFFTNAGMVQFKGMFLGQETRKYTRAVTAQRCLRASGKHNDLETVGYTNRHHTFFEMLGNFSFGDYFKREAIHYAWEFLTKELGIEPKKLWVTVHQDDQETEKLWQDEFQATHTEPQGLSHCGDKDNFWAMGDTGPCGYCSEIFYDHGDGLVGDPPGGKHEGERYVEIWNLVFMQFERDCQGKLTSLPKPSIDTGMGLERIAAVMQGTHDNYAIDVFVELQRKFMALLQEKFGASLKALRQDSQEVRIASRVVTDHIRATTFLIADGVFPSNEKTGYVLRSIIRRAVYYLYRLGVREPFFYQLVSPLVELVGKDYPEIELDKLQAPIAVTIQQEELKFLDTLERGLKIFNSEIAELKNRVIPGTIAFNLHDTYGLPIILTTEIARQRGFTIDQAGFAVEMEKQRELSRAACKGETVAPVKLAGDLMTKFLGYTVNSCTTKICGLFKKDGAPIDIINAQEEGVIALEQTPFYAESGGQVGDSGEIYVDDKLFIVQDTQKCSNLYLHSGYVAKGSLVVGAEVTAEIDSKRRQMIKLNHSATHLLHNSLRAVVGEYAMQRGSSVDNKRLRFDFTNVGGLTTEEIAEVEQLVNAKIRADAEVTTVVKSLEEAKQEGAFALFGEKYGDEVRVVAMGEFSKELCGGTHVKSTGEIGLFKVVSEAGIAAGVRRIEAVTGECALARVEKLETELQGVASLLGIGFEQVSDKVRQLIEEKRVQDKELSRLQFELMGIRNQELVRQAVKIAGISVLTVKLSDIDGKILRQMADDLKIKLQSGVVVLAVVKDGKVQLVVSVTKDLLTKIKACDLLQYLNQQIDGSGGGKAELAQGGGVKVAALPAALDSVVPWVEKKLLDFKNT